MSEITEAKLYEAFGLTPTEQGEQVQETAEPAAETDSQTGNGEQEQELAEPAQPETDTDTGDEAESDADSDDPDEEDPQTDKDTGKDKQPLTLEQRRANAARRREQEQQEATQKAVDAAVQAEQLKNKQMLEQVLALAGIKNTSTGETITTIEDFQQWSKEMADARLEKDQGRCWNS